MMKVRMIAFMVAMLTVLTGQNAIGSEQAVDWYKFKMVLRVPRVYDNTQSSGYRKYQRQKISGYMSISYDCSGESYGPTIRVFDLENSTHKIGGRKIIYSCTVDDGFFVVPRVNYIGNNKTGKFTTPTIVFRLDAEPSYNKGEDDEDNSLFVTLSGHGTSFTRSVSGAKIRIPKRFSGTVAGTLGCGCSAYGHVSPTRVADCSGASDVVDDVAPVHGTWYAVFVQRNGCMIWYK